MSSPGEPDTLAQELLIEEDFKSQVYPDSRGFQSIGIGRCVDPKVKGSGLTRAEAVWLCHNDCIRVRSEVNEEWPWVQHLPEMRQNVIYQMAFQMGVDGLRRWATFMEYVRTSRYALASQDLLSQKYASECPNRAKRLAKQILTGVSQYPVQPQSNYKPSDIH